MMKICPKCRATFAGGDFCLDCGVRHLLIDMADPRAEELLAGDEMRLAVMSHYAERRGMVRSAVAFLVGTALAAFTLRQAFGVTGWARVGWVVAAVGVFAIVMRIALRHVFRIVKANNQGQLAYTCPDEDKPLRLLGKPKKGFGWTTW
jgi:hypothetical protein